MRRRGKVDRNHGDIVDALRQAGATVESLADLGNGIPDLLIGFRGQNFVAEVKDGLLPPSRQRLTDDEVLWHRTWNGQIAVVRSVSEALALLRERN